MVALGLCYRVSCPTLSLSFSLSHSLSLGASATGSVAHTCARARKLAHASARTLAHGGARTLAHGGARTLAHGSARTHTIVAHAHSHMAAHAHSHMVENKRSAGRRCALHAQAFSCASSRQSPVPPGFPMSLAHSLACACIRTFYKPPSYKCTNTKEERRPLPAARLDRTFRQGHWQGARPKAPPTVRDKRYGAREDGRWETTSHLAHPLEYLLSSPVPLESLVSQEIRDSRRFEGRVALLDPPGPWKKAPCAMQEADQTADSERVEGTADRTTRAHTTDTIKHGRTSTKETRKVRTALFISLQHARTHARTQAHAHGRARPHTRAPTQ